MIKKVISNEWRFDKEDYSKTIREIKFALEDETIDREIECEYNVETGKVEFWGFYRPGYMINHRLQEGEYDRIEKIIEEYIKTIDPLLDVDQYE